MEKWLKRIREGIMNQAAKAGTKPDKITASEEEATKRNLEMARQLPEAQLQATTDALTGIPNRFVIMNDLATGIERAKRFGEPMCVMFLDLNHFKQINDTFGHEAGDAALKEFAARIRGKLRKVDVAGRLGGDEFVIILEKTTPAGAAIVANKIISAVSSTPVLLPSERQITISASIGISIFDPSKPAGLSATTLLDKADAAMYRAKQSGSNKFEISE